MGRTFLRGGKPGREGLLVRPDGQRDYRPPEGAGPAGLKRSEEPSARTAGVPRSVRVGPNPALQKEVGPKT